MQSEGRKRTNAVLLVLRGFCPFYTELPAWDRWSHHQIHHCAQQGTAAFEPVYPFWLKWVQPQCTQNEWTSFVPITKSLFPVHTVRFPLRVGARKGKKRKRADDGQDALPAPVHGPLDAWLQGKPIKAAKPRHCPANTDLEDNGQRPQMVKLNVGGKMLSAPLTALTTLKDTFFESMFGGRHMPALFAQPRCTPLCSRCIVACTVANSFRCPLARFRSVATHTRGRWLLLHRS